MVRFLVAGVRSDGIIILHDNASLHTANLVRDKLQRFSWKTLHHPPNRPDLSPCYFHTFGDLKNDICGYRFHSGEEVQEWMRLWIHQQPISFYKTGIDRLVLQWDKCINTIGNYFWIKQIRFSIRSGCSVLIELPLILFAIFETFWKNGQNNTR